MGSKKYESFEKEEIIKEVIRNELSKIEYDFDCSGTNYILEAIYVICILEKNEKFNLTKEIYPIIERKHNITENNIKVSIKYATDKMYFECKEEVLKKYMNRKKFTKSPRPKNIIKSVLEKIKKVA